MCAAITAALRGRLTAQVAAAVVGLSTCFSAQGEPTEAARAAWPCMQGTYIQLSDANRGWTTQQWETLFSYLDALKIGSIVVQWSAVDDQAFYKTDRFNGSPVPAIELILSLANAHHMTVMVGLHHRSNHWAQVGAVESQESYLRGQLEQDALIAGQLKTTVAASPSFGGWYVSEEIDDLNWIDVKSNRFLRSYLLQVTMLLKTLTPGAPIGISAFANAESAPESVGRFWDHLFQEIKSLDVLYFQDGIGVRKLSLAVLPAYYEALQHAASVHGKQLRPVVELFEQTGGAPVDTGAFVAVPASTDRIRQQMKIAAQYARKITTFSVPEYLSPIGGPAAAQAFEETRGALASTGVSCL